MTTIVPHDNNHRDTDGRAIRWSTLFRVLLAGLLWLPACSPREDEPDEEAATAVVPVEVERVERRDLQRVAQATASLSALEERVVLSESAGRVTRVLLGEGDEVSERAELARIENDDIRLSGEDAEATVRRLEREIAEIRPLVEQGFLPRQQLDDLEFRLDQASTARQRVRSQQTSQRVRAPIGGVLVARMVEPGDIVVPNQQLFRIVATGALEAVVNLPERELAHVRVGQQALLRVPAIGVRDYLGEVERIHPVVDARTGTVRVRVRVTDEHAFSGDLPLRPGNFAEVRIVTEEREQVPAIPRRAIVHEGTSPFLMVVGARDESARAPEVFGEGVAVHRVDRVPVVLGHADDRYVELLEGPPPGSWIVTVGQGGLESGSLVVPMRDGQAIDDAGTPPGAGGDDGASAADEEVGPEARLSDAEAPGEEP